MGTLRLAIQTQTALEILLGDLRLFHDATQLRCFVLSAEGHGTVWGIYRQCLRELDSRRTTLQGRRRDMDTAAAELTYAKARARRWAFTAEGRRDRAVAVIDIDKYSCALENLAFQISEVERELKLFIEVGQACKEKLGTISDERRETLDQQFWEVKFGRQAELSLATTGKLDAGIVQLVMHLPEASFQNVVARLGSAELVQGLSRLRGGSMVVEDIGNGVVRRPPGFERVSLEAIDGG